VVLSRSVIEAAIWNFAGVPNEEIGNAITAHKTLLAELESKSWLAVDYDTLLIFVLHAIGDDPAANRMSSSTRGPRVYVNCHGPRR